MQVKRVPVKAQDYDKVVHIDNSATHWSLEHSKHAAAALSALSTYQDLLAAKNQAVSEMVKAADIPVGKVVQARLVKDEKGEAFVEVMVRDDEAPAEASAAEAPTPAS